MIAHVVLLQPKTETTPQEIEQVLEQVRTLQHSIPGIVDVQAGANISKNHQGYTHGFILLTRRIFRPMLPIRHICP